MFHRFTTALLVTGILSLSCVPSVFAEDITQCSQLSGSWQRSCNRLENRLSEENAALGDKTRVPLLNEKRLSLLRRYNRAVDRSVANNVKALQAAFKQMNIVVFASSSKPLCDGSIAIVSRTLDKTKCRFSR